MDRIFIEVSLKTAFNIKELKGNIEDLIVAISSILICQRLKKYKTKKMKQFFIQKIANTTATYAMCPEPNNSLMSGSQDVLSTDNEVKETSDEMSPLTAIAILICPINWIVDVDYSLSDRSISRISTKSKPNLNPLNSSFFEFKGRGKKLAKKENIVNEVKLLTSLCVMQVINSTEKIKNGTINSVLEKLIELRDISDKSNEGIVSSRDRHCVTLALNAAYEAKTLEKENIESNIIDAVISALLVVHQKERKNDKAFLRPGIYPVTMEHLATC